VIEKERKREGFKLLCDIEMTVYVLRERKRGGKREREKEGERDGWRERKRDGEGGERERDFLHDMQMPK